MKRYVSIGCIAVAVVMLIWYFGNPAKEAAPRRGPTTERGKERPKVKARANGAIALEPKASPKPEDRTRPDLVSSYEAAFRETPRNDEFLKLLLTRIGQMEPATDAWRTLLELVSLHSDSTADQLLTAHATRIALDLMRIAPGVIDLSLDRFAVETEPRAVHVLSQSLAMARTEGLFDESISLEFYAAYHNSDDWLARQLLVNTVHGTGEQEWIVELARDALLEPCEIYHPNPSDVHGVAARAVDKIFQYEKSRRKAGWEETDSRPRLRDAIVAAARKPNVSAGEWVALYRLARSNIPDAATEILTSTKSEDPGVRQFRDYFESLEMAAKQLEGRSGD